MIINDFSAKVYVLLLFFSAVSFCQAQTGKSEVKVSPRMVIEKNSAEIAEIQDFAFVVEINQNADVSVKIQKTENNEFLADADSNQNLTDFFTAFSSIQAANKTAKNKLEPIIVIKADNTLEFGKIRKIIESLRVSPKQKIKLEIKENYYVGVPSVAPSDKSFAIKPNPLFLLVELKNDSQILLNREAFGSLSDSSPMTEKLKEIFQDREVNGVFREGSAEIEKTVFFSVPDSVKFSDVIKLVESISETGASPIGLQIDDLTPSEPPPPPRK